MFDTAIRRFLVQSRRFNAVILNWETVIPIGDIPVRGLIQPVYNNRARWHIPDYSAFGAKPDIWGVSRPGDSLLNRLKAHRLKQQIKNETAT